MFIFCSFLVLQTTKEEDRKKWEDVKNKYNEMGILLYADESISVVGDIDMFKKYVDGVNIKLEKAGGIREAIGAIDRANKYGLKVK